MRFLLADKDGASFGGDALIVGVSEGLDAQLQSLDNHLGVLGTIELPALLKTRHFHTLGKLPFKYLVVVGLGKKPDARTIRKASGAAAKVCRDLGAKKVATLLPTNPEGIAAAVEGTLLGLYAFTKFKTSTERKEIEEFEILRPSTEENISAVRRGQVFADSIILVRNLVNEPASHKYPERFTQHVRESLRDLPVRVTVHGKRDLEAMGMHAILAVNKGSPHEPRLILLEYGEGTPIALVGKGVTFDSGGLSLKTPADYMEDMKSDMAGAASVLAVVKTAAELRLPVKVLGFMGLTENMPGGDAYKPGDIITAYNKKTIEILNTDAEGRVVLADVLAYAESFKPAAMIDIATLTGACVMALGTIASGVIGTSQGLIDKVLDAADAADEKMWQLPLYDEYLETVKSDFADVRNSTGRGPGAGAQMGAAFLRSFVNDTPWCHLDIAGPAWTIKENAITSKGGTGFCVRTLVKLLEGWK